ncbi:MAG: Panacea domain-containing protein [Tissierellaceae bacterium]|jgi:uncharacterized phage-associated protein
MKFLDYGDLSDYIIAYCNLYSLEISNKKLQKLMYYCQAWTLALHDEKLIDNDFEAWIHGAVLRPIYFKYSRYGYNNIHMEKDISNNILDRAKHTIPNYKLDLINKVLEIYGSYSADELEDMNHSEAPWIAARGCLNNKEICDEKIDNVLMQRYYKSIALERGMKEVKNNIFKFSSTNLKKAQENLRKKEVFKVNEDNYVEYEKFILDSYEATLDITERAEYGRTI